MAKQETERCGHKNGCDHTRGQHRDAERGLPAMCLRCKHGRGAHAFVPRSAVAA